MPSHYGKSHKGKTMLKGKQKNLPAAALKRKIVASKMKKKKKTA